MHWKNRIIDGEDYLIALLCGGAAWSLAALVLLFVVGAGTYPHIEQSVHVMHGDIELVVAPEPIEDEISLGALYGSTWYFALPGILFGYFWAPSSTAQRKRLQRQCATLALRDMLPYPEPITDPIVAVIVSGGAANVVSNSDHVRTCVIDLDCLRESGETVELPRNRGYEALLDGLRLERYITYVDAGVAK